MDEFDSRAGYDPGAIIITYSKISSFTYSMAQKDSYIDTTYQVTLSTTAKDLDGNPMHHPFEFSFKTAPFCIRSTYPRNGQLFVDTDYVITMYFNTYMLKSSVESTFRITPEISGRFKYGTEYSESDDKTVITFIPYTNFITNTKYTVSLDTGVKDMFGAHINEPYVFAFITSPE